MQRIIPVSIAAVVLFAGNPAEARPNFGRNCSDCHNGGAPPAAAPIEVVNFDGVADPDESQTGATDRGLLKFFEVLPGESVDLSVRIDFETLQDHLFGVELKRMETTGVVTGGTLGYGDDPDWFFQTGDTFPDPDSPYYTIPDEEGMLFTEPTEFTFTMFVDEATDPDFFDLEFAIAGQPNFFYADEHFYLKVVPEPATAVWLTIAIGLTIRRRRSQKT